MIFRAFCTSAVVLLLLGCGSATPDPAGPNPPPPPAPPPPPPPPPPSLARIEIEELPSDFRVRGGSQVQLVARVFSDDGSPAPLAPITWQVREASVASVSSQGMVSFRSDTVLGSRSHLVRAMSGSLRDSVSIFSRDWELVGPSELRLAPERRPGLIPGPFEFLSIACVAGEYAAAVAVDGYSVGPPVIQYRFSGADAVQQTWVFSPTGYDATLYSPGGDISRQFGAMLFSADSLYVQPPSVPERHWLLKAPELLRAGFIAAGCD